MRAKGMTPNRRALAPRNPRDPDGDPEGLVFSPKDIKAHASLVVLVKQAADLLERHYPEWLWAIQPDERGGVINIWSLRLSGQWGYTLKTERLQNEPRMESVLRAGGELLERFGFAAGPFNRERYRAKTLVMGEHVADVSDLAPRARRDYRTHQIQRGLQSGRARILTDADLPAALCDPNVARN